MAWRSGRPSVVNRHRQIRWWALLFVVAAAALLPGCGIGPPMVERDQIDYQNALSESWKRQMLMNLVRSRYADAPVFLDTTSIINQYSVEAEIKGLGILKMPIWSYEQQYYGIGRYYDRPTITYIPMTGDKFARNLLSPIPPASLVALVQSGWPVDFVFRMTCESINGIRNRSGGQLQGQVADPRFEELLKAMRRIQLADTIGLRLEGKAGAERAVIFFGHQLSEETKADAIRVRELLGLSPQATEFSLVFGSTAGNSEEIAILSRSMMQLMVELGSCIEVPEKHITGGLTFRPPDSPRESQLIRIHAGRFKPFDSCVAVPYKGYWYWIDDGDFQSKRMMTLLMMFFSMTASVGGAGAPMVTVSAGG
ncbi:MAG: hypothetical protein JW955_24815 [Sedimentisphaerales bacterium]|nr:hypothetical protein [Sedimentisphaerales bacterium]